ncbi:unnamed protein product [Phytophthora lilii]|uniref:Unnamed protein product n=1 Tax=Phytophthora lilii TaxID=2077276 RepID=A0A9W6WNM3_9STRA|nr:unnamed protein product [Phytophthora lilii]
MEKRPLSLITFDSMILKKDANTPGIYYDAEDSDEYEDDDASSCNDSDGDADEAANSGGDCAEAQGPTQEAMNYGLAYTYDYTSE